MRYALGMSNAHAVSSPLNNGANEIVAANIRGHLGFKGRKQADLARHLGLSEMSLSRRMKSYADFSAPEIAAAAEYLGTSPGDLFDEKNLQITVRSLATVTALPIRPHTSENRTHDAVVTPIRTAG